VSGLEVLVVGAVLIGMSVQAAIGFGFAFFVAPAAFAAFNPEQAVTLILVLGLIINVLVLGAERRRTEVATHAVAIMLVAAIPGMIAGAWLVTQAEPRVLQLLVGVIVLVGAAVQWFAASAERPRSGATHHAPRLEVGGGFAAGVLTTSVTVNGPALVLVFGALGLRGNRFRDSLAAILLGLSVVALPVVLVASEGEQALPGLAVILACVPALLIGHQFGAAVFRRLDDAAHHRAALVAAGIAGVLSIAAALL
jgi:uncharacterized membrane protein YfcA